MHPWLGIPLALLSGLLESLVDVTRKESKKAFNPWSAAWGMRFYGALLLLPLAYALHPHDFPSDKMFWLAMAGSVAINSVTSVLYMRAITESDMSLVLPIVTLSPVFMIVTSPFITGEVPSLLGITGIVLSGAGVYLLGLDEKSKGIFAPFLLLWRNKEMRMMLLVAILWSISAPIEKIAIQHGDRFWFAGLVNLGLTLSLTPTLIHFGQPRQALASLDSLKRLAPIGAFAAAGLLCQYTAISVMLVPYAIGMKRTSVLWGVLWGKLLYGENKFRDRFIAALLTLAGTVLILFTEAR